MQRPSEALRENPELEPVREWLRQHNAKHTWSREWRERDERHSQDTYWVNGCPLLIFASVHVGTHSLTSFDVWGSLSNDNDIAHMLERAAKYAGIKPIAPEADEPQPTVVIKCRFIEERPGDWFYVGPIGHLVANIEDARRFSTLDFEHALAAVQRDFPAYEFDTAPPPEYLAAQPS